MFLACLLALAAPPATVRPPNVVVLLADDIGWGDLGCYGQTEIQTPRLDKLAAEGVRFTRCYSGSTVCGPSRCALMTGLHTGHCRVRGNAKGDTALTADDTTVAKLLQSKGYATAVVGKWGLGREETTGRPSLQGFDFSFGYMNHQHAHNYYPDHLWKNETRVDLPNRIGKTPGVAEVREVYAPDLCRDEALKFLDANQTRPFFLYFATTLPHANNEKTRLDGNGNEVPTDEPYSDRDWPAPERNKAAMITRLDADIGAILDKLEALGVADNTLVLFSSDNGPHKEGGNDPAFFRSSGPYRGIKRSLTDGGIRVPGIVRWPGVVKPGTTSDHVWAFWDVLPTLAEVAGAPTPADLDGLSFAPTLTGKGEQKRHEFLYWEFHEQGFHQAVLHGEWKGIRAGLGGKLRLYDTKADPGESTDVSAANPDVVRRIEEYLKTARIDSPLFPIRAVKK